jgi:hypothetical protein
MSSKTNAAIAECVLKSAGAVRWLQIKCKAKHVLSWMIPKSARDAEGACEYVPVGQLKW